MRSRTKVYVRTPIKARGNSEKEKEDEEECKTISFLSLFSFFSFLYFLLPVKLPVHVLELGIGNVRVDLCSGEVLVAEKLLHTAEIRTIA